VRVKVREEQHARAPQHRHDAKFQKVLGGVTRRHEDEGGVSEDFREGEGVVLRRYVAGEGEGTRFEQRVLEALEE